MKCGRLRNRIRTQEKAPSKEDAFFAFNRLCYYFNTDEICIASNYFLHLQSPLMHL